MIRFSLNRQYLNVLSQLNIKNMKIKQQIFGISEKPNTLVLTLKQPAIWRRK